MDVPSDYYDTLIAALRAASDQLEVELQQLGTQRATRIRTYINMMMPRIEMGESVASAQRYAEYACVEQDVELAVAQGRVDSLHVRVATLTTIINSLNL